MSETLEDRSDRSSSQGLPVLVLHAAQLLFTIVLLGLDCYGIRYIAYDRLVYSLFVVSIPI